MALGQALGQALGSEEVFQTTHLLFQLSYQSVVGILIDHCITVDLFGTVCIPVVERWRVTALQSLQKSNKCLMHFPPECAEGLLVVDVCGTEGRNHCSARIPPCEHKVL